MARSRRKINPQASPGWQVKLPEEASSSPPAALDAQAVYQIEPSEPVIFISYSHEDRRWVDRILVHLKPLERYGSLTIWEDSRIRPGGKWQSEIEEALDNAIAAVLVVSANFLASGFVMNEEVPVLLRNAEGRGTSVIPLIVGPSLFEYSALSSFQAINSPGNPLSKLNAHRRDEILVNLATSIASCFDEAHIERR
jgi:hypothetical protein